MIDKNLFKGEIEFSNVSFSYPCQPDVTVLSNLSFKIKEGQEVAFVGESGSGKTSIVKLLMRLYDPNKGAILLDGLNLKEINLKKYH